MSASRTAKVLWLLLALFVCRVMGQLIVVLYAPSFLPPMEKWYSGLMPYPYLLPSQILIIIFLGKIALDISRGKGFWAEPKPRLGLWIRNFGIIYFVSMVVRFALQGVSIPVVFHWVLAAFLFIAGSFILRSQSQ